MFCFGFAKTALRSPQELLGDYFAALDTRLIIGIHAKDFAEEGNLQHKEMQEVSECPW